MEGPTTGLPREDCSRWKTAGTKAVGRVFVPRHLSNRQEPSKQGEGGGEQRAARVHLETTTSTLVFMWGGWKELEGSEQSDTELKGTLWLSA